MKLLSFVLFMFLKPLHLKNLTAQANLGLTYCRWKGMVEHSVEWMLGWINLPNTHGWYLGAPQTTCQVYCCLCYSNYYFTDGLIPVEFSIVGQCFILPLRVFVYVSVFLHQLVDNAKVFAFSDIWNQNVSLFKLISYISLHQTNSCGCEVIFVS